MCNLYSMMSNREAIWAMLQRALPDGALKVIARGDRRGDPSEAVVAA